MGSYLYFQSGGPTAVINSSLNGVIRRCRDLGITLYGARNGIEGFIKKDVVRLDNLPNNRLALLRQTPGMALGSSRMRVRDDFAHWEEIGNTIRELDVDVVLVNGGNDSMDTALRIYQHFSSWGLRVIGIPKTIDNDLFGTDFCPGYPSACRHAMNSIASIVLDGSVYSKGKVNLIEVQGREAGWITASASLLEGKAAVDMVLLPEGNNDIDAICEKIAEIYHEKGNCFVAMSEGIDIPHESYDEADSFGRHSPEGASYGLASILKKKYGLPSRCSVLGTLCRSNPYLISSVDSLQAQWLGEAAVEEGSRGNTGIMVGLRRASGKELHFTLQTTPLEECANFEHMFPTEWIKENGTLDKAFKNYLKPLLKGDMKIKVGADGLFLFAEI